MADFTDLTRVKRWLKIAPANVTDDDILNDLIPEVTGEFLGFLARDIFLTSYVDERRNGNGQPRLTLKQFPVQNVSSVKIDTLVIQMAADPTAAGYSFDDREVYLNQIPPAVLQAAGVGSGFGYTGRAVFSRGFLNVEIAYTAGYNPGDPVLTELRNAATQQVAYEYMKRNRIGEKTKTLGQAQTVSYLTDHFDPVVLAILKRHRRVAPVIT